MREVAIPLRAPDGREVARFTLAPADDASPIFTLAPDLALRENGRYEYELDRPGLRLRCALARPSRMAGARERGLIETGAHCGLLRLDAVDARGDLAGSAWADVRSVKLGEPAHYRAMLADIGARLTGLLIDARASSQLPLTAAWRDEPRALQQQVEFLRATLESPAFAEALRRIQSNPHRRARAEPVFLRAGQPVRRGRDLARQFISAPVRAPMPAAHALAQSLRQRGVAQPSAPACVSVTVAVDDLDTPENQFVRYALATFRDFLARAADALAAHGPAWGGVAERARRAAGGLDQRLAGAFFAGLALPRRAPLDSPVLQRRAGYRDVLQAYLRFEANAQVDWPAADDVFHAGQRDTAQLYEYWLFFHLLDWFCDRFGGARADARSLVRIERGRVMLALRHGDVAGPFEGEAATGGRVRGQFSYNRVFAPGADETQAGSWSRAMRPDFTLTLWPGGRDLSRAEAEGSAVHLHLDAKYRVDDLERALDAPAEADAGDVLKMHAYRDAIRRSAGAFVLYPGASGDERPEVLRRSRDVLPSLGAFPITPDADGLPRGLAQLRAFLDAAIDFIAAGRA